MSEIERLEQIVIRDSQNLEARVAYLLACHRNGLPLPSISINQSEWYDWSEFEFGVPRDQYGFPYPPLNAMPLSFRVQDNKIQFAGVAPIGDYELYQFPSDLRPANVPMVFFAVCDTEGFKTGDSWLEIKPESCHLHVVHHPAYFWCEYPYDLCRKYLDNFDD